MVYISLSFRDMTRDGRRTDRCRQPTHFWLLKRADYNAPDAQFHVSDSSQHTLLQQLNTCSICRLVHFTSDKERGTFFPRVRLSDVSLLERLLKNARIGLDEMLRVDRCRDMDELINF